MSLQRHMDIVKARSRLQFMQSKQRFMTRLIGKRGMYGQNQGVGGRRGQDDLEDAAEGESEYGLEPVPEADAAGPGDNAEAAPEAP